MMRLRTRFISLGVGFLVALVAISYLTILLFTQHFVSTVPLTLQSSRAGLMMDPGAPVKLRGVQIGSVKSIESDGGGAKLDLKIFPKNLGSIPSNVTAKIVPPTAFGAKYVELDAPAVPSSTAITAGSVIDANHVTVEVNDAFQHIVTLLDKVPASSVNSALTAMSTALDGRGEQIGGLITDTNSYLKALDPYLPALKTGMKTGSNVLNTYSSVAPQLLKIAKNGTTTSNTFVQEQADFGKLLVTFSGDATKIKGFLQKNRSGLHSALADMKPTMDLLAEYSPEFPCTLEGMVVDHTLGMGVFGGPNPGMNMVVHLVPSATPYKAPQNLPEVRADNPPNCYMLPNVPVDKIHTPNPTFDVGANPFQEPESKGVQSITQILFGALGGAVTP